MAEVDDIVQRCGNIKALIHAIQDERTIALKYIQNMENSTEEAFLIVSASTIRRAKDIIMWEKTFQSLILLKDFKSMETFISTIELNQKNVTSVEVDSKETFLFYNQINEHLIKAITTNIRKINKDIVWKRMLSLKFMMRFAENKLIAYIIGIEYFNQGKL